MKSALFVRVVLALLLAVPVARAEEPTASTKGFDCWISVLDSYYQAHYILCIENRSTLPPLDASTAAPNQHVLDEIHRLVHEGTHEELDTYVAINMPLLEPADLWRIPILSYPTESSWEEERPQTLARMLCAADDCPIFFRRW
ncbi:MAG: hypothetical protein ROZ37_07815 [Aromatoleum sp.]|uniref:hypothetical protein n=1 Tax=Aromatoleum sp. TaxID=2307007 RepID=UPI002893AE44|nr:hypothetical protein [Aromatoleum sp.]MDT3670226.1 hypothetical protein [Aromatoleum sp.]